MKLTRSLLKQIIKEELQKTVAEDETVTENAEDVTEETAAEEETVEEEFDVAAKIAHLEEELQTLKSHLK